MDAAQRDCRARWIVFGVVFAVAALWTAYTNHVWEDFYITYRASKNLADGNGFTFTPGERVHSYTSPLGTLLPAGAYLLTGRSSDTAALWIFRTLSIAALAAAAAVLWTTARRAFSARGSAVFVVALLASDAKTVDFTINGMETPYLLLFLAWTLHALAMRPPRLAVHLGVAWAGLMWSRPDSFVYIAALAAGALLFHRKSEAARPVTGGTLEHRGSLPSRSFWGERWALLKTFFIAGCITTLLYGPWILWAWWYYGSPVPHTVTAKGLGLGPPNLSLVFQWLGDFPFRVFRDGGSLATTFLPPYGLHSGWPDWTITCSRWLSCFVLFIWALPRVPAMARVASFAFALGHFYLTYFANYPAPWYIPVVTTLAIVALAGALDAAVSIARNAAWTRAFGVVAAAAAVALILSAATLSALTSHQMRLSQRLSETGNRRLIGEWLRANASTPKDTVFLECLGYIGFFSNLKMYDFPGLCSPEVVELRRRSRTVGFYNEYFPELIRALEPDWVVLRESEVRQVRKQDRYLLERFYRLERVFDIRPKLDAIAFIPGRRYLEFDSRFEVYRRNWDRAKGESPQWQPPIRVERLTKESFVENRTWAGPAYESKGKLAAHAPSRLVAKLPENSQAVVGGFGFFPGAHENPAESTRGGVFTINAILRDGGRVPILTAVLDPMNNELDRGDQPFEAKIPADSLQLEFLTEPREGEPNAFAWMYWTGLALEIETRD